MVRTFKNVQENNSCGSRKKANFFIRAGKNSTFKFNGQQKSKGKLSPSSGIVIGLYELEKNNTFTEILKTKNGSPQRTIVTNKLEEVNPMLLCLKKKFYVHDGLITETGEDLRSIKVKHDDNDYCFVIYSFGKEWQKIFTHNDANPFGSRSTALDNFWKFLKEIDENAEKLTASTGNEDTNQQFALLLCNSKRDADFEDEKGFGMVKVGRIPKISVKLGNKTEIEMARIKKNQENLKKENEKLKKELIKKEKLNAKKLEILKINVLRNAKHWTTSAITNHTIKSIKSSDTMIIGKKNYNFWQLNSKDDRAWVSKHDVPKANTFFQFDLVREKYIKGIVLQNRRFTNQKQHLTSLEISISTDGVKFESLGRFDGFPQPTQRSPGHQKTLNKEILFNYPVKAKHIKLHNMDCSEKRSFRVGLLVLDIKLVKEFNF